MEIENELLYAYAEDLLQPRDKVLSDMEAFAAREGVPIVGPRVGTLLTILASSRKKALELGTAIGYSATWIARGMAADGKLITVEAREGMANIARENLERSGLRGRVEVVVGEALDVLPDLGRDFDFIFNDIDKGGYPASLPLCKAALKAGGMLVTDNVLWKGRVALYDDEAPSTKAIREYNNGLAADPDMITVILPIRDGVSISVKRS